MDTNQFLKLVALMKEGGADAAEAYMDQALAAAAAAAVPAAPGPRPTRCCQEGCKKKLMLSDFPCKCEKIYCAGHRPSEVHACSFDYKAAAKGELLKTMAGPIAGKKIDRI